MYGGRLFVPGSYQFRQFRHSFVLHWKFHWTFKHITTMAKKTHRKVFSSHGDQILINFCEVAVESSLTRNITNWHGSCTAWDKKALQRGIKTTQNITGTHPQSIGDIGDVRWDVGTEHKGYWKTTRDPDTVCSSCTHPAKLPNVIAVWTVPDISSKVMTKSQKNVLVKSNPTKHEATLHL